MSSATITLNPNPRGKYYVAGDTISGKVTLVSKSAKTLAQANIQLFAESRIKYDVSHDWKINEKQSYLDFTTKLLTSPIKLSAGESQIFEFAIKIPMKKHLVSIVPKMNIEAYLGSYYLDCDITFVEKFDGFFSDDVKSTARFPLGPMTSPDLFSSSSPEPFKNTQDLRGTCGCFSSKCDSVVILEGCPTACFFQGEMTFPVRVKIQPPPGVFPNFINFCLESGVAGLIGRRLLHREKFYEWNKHLDSATEQPVAIEGQGEGWYCYDFEAKIDFKDKELLTGNGSLFSKYFFWGLEITYSNGRKGVSPFLTVGCAYPSSERFNESSVEIEKEFKESK